MESDSSGDEFDPNELMDAGGTIAKEEDESSSEGSEASDDDEEMDKKEENGREIEQKEKKTKGRKERLRKQFDAEFDQTNEHYNALKEEVDKQSKAITFIH